MATLSAEYLLREGSGTTAHDTSGNGFDGTLQGGGNIPVWFAQGLQFNGNTGGVVLLPDAVITNGNTVSDVSVEAWVKVNSGAGTGYVSSLCTDCESIVTADGGTWESQYFDASFGFIGQADSVTAVDTNWHHIVWLRQGSGSTALSIYIDGVLDANGTAFTANNIGLSSGAGSKYIGGDPLGLASVNGDVGEIRFWVGALTSTEVLNQFNSTKSRYIGAPPALLLSCARLVARLGGIYSSALVASGGTPGYTYAIVSGSLPPGLSLNTSTGAITGTATTAGTYPYTAQVTDSAAVVTTVSCSIKVVTLPGPNAEYLLREGTGTIAHDTSGNGYDGTLVAGPHIPVWVSNGLQFDASSTSNSVALPDAVLAFDNTSITHASIEVWAVLSASTSAGQIVTLDNNHFAVDWNDPTSPFGFHPGLFGGIAWSNNGSYVQQGEAQTTLPGDTIFRHVVFTYDGTDLKIYYDGVLQGSVPAANPGLALALGESAGSKALGGDPVNGFFSFAGIIGEVRIYNITLSSVDIAALYNQTRPIYPISTPASTFVFALSVSQAGTITNDGAIDGFFGPSRASIIDYSEYANFSPMLTGSVADCSFGQRTMYRIGTVLYKVLRQAPLPDRSFATCGMYKSTDDGATWTQLDAGNRPVNVSSLFGNITSSIFGSVIYMLQLNPSGSLWSGFHVIPFDTVTETWGTATPDILNTDSTTMAFPGAFGIHATGLNEFSVVWVNINDTGGHVTTPQMWLIRYTSGSWGTATQICTDVSRSVLTGFVVDDATTTAHIFYSARPTQSNTFPFDSTLPNPNLVAHRTIDSSGTLSGPDTVIANAAPWYGYGPAQFVREYPCFGQGISISGNLIVPFAYSPGIVVNPFPGVAVLSSGTWTTTQLTSGDILADDPGDLITVALAGSTVYALWISDQFTDVINYVTSADAGLTWTPTFATLVDGIATPLPFTDVFTGFENLFTIFPAIASRGRRVIEYIKRRMAHGH